jgi:hypothetical protein
MDAPEYRLINECLALIRELFTQDIVDDFDQEFGVGGYGFITNGRLYKISFNIDGEPLAFTLAAGCACPYMEATQPVIAKLIVDMNKAHPSSHYRWGGVYGAQMGVSAEGLVPDSADRMRFVQAELLRCKQVLDLALDGQQAVISADD